MENERNVGTRPAYRRDVDGLRAVAVLLVLADHFVLKLRGGYVGVDVFFVISGYLISGIILAEIAQGRFSIVRFYERRIRRIFPALLVMLAIVTVLVYFLFTPTEIEAYGASALATVLSGSNFLFWGQSGYFDDASLIKPLLHTWSLAVEEQFYILFPLFLMLVTRYVPGKLKAFVLAITGISFICAVYVARIDSAAAFYFAPLRAWELLFGTIVSQNYLPAIKGALARNVASGVGFLLILWSAWVYSGTTLFPGVSALPPCLGAALIIAAGETGSSFVGRILSLRPVVFIGLISYSVYLWHWPLLVFQRTNAILPINVEVTRWKVLMVFVSLAVGAISWALVEQPFRKGRFRPSRNAVFGINGVVAGVLAVVALIFIAAHGFPGRFSAQALKVAAVSDSTASGGYRAGTCFLTPKYSFSNFRQDVCLHRGVGKRTILVAGDSHAAALWPGINAVFTEDSVMQASASGCHPLLVEPSGQRRACYDLFAFIFKDYLLHNHVDVLLLSGRWKSTDMEALGQTLAYTREHNIYTVVVGPGVEYDTPLPRMLAIAIRDGRTVDPRRHLIAELIQLDKTMASLARDRWHVPYISIYKDLCAAECPMFAEPDVPLLLDASHFTTPGATLLARAMKEKGELSGGSGGGRAGGTAARAGR